MYNAHTCSVVHILEAKVSRVKERKTAGKLHNEDWTDNCIRIVQ